LRIHTGEKPYLCKEEGCNYASAQQSNLSTHIQGMHDIGRHRCDYCLQNRNSRNAHLDTTLHASVNLCRACFRKATGKDSRVEQVWSEFVDAALGTDFLVGSDDAMRTLGGCSLKRPDRLYASSDRVEIDECDEHQHANSSSGGYTCEEKRLSELYDEPSICGKQLVVVRWNPHAYTPQPGSTRASRTERLRLFVDVKRHLRSLPNTAFKAPIVVVYMFYDRDSTFICRRLPHAFVDEAADITRLTSLYE
jgi:hypothetical protein